MGGRAASTSTRGRQAEAALNDRRLAGRRPERVRRAGLRRAGLGRGGGGRNRYGQPLPPIPDERRAPCRPVPPIDARDDGGRGHGARREQRSVDAATHVRPGMRTSPMRSVRAGRGAHSGVARDDRRGAAEPAGGVGARDGGAEVRRAAARRHGRRRVAHDRIVQPIRPRGHGRRGRRRHERGEHERGEQARAGRARAGRARAATMAMLPTSSGGCWRSPWPACALGPHQTRSRCPPRRRRSPHTVPDGLPRTSPQATHLAESAGRPVTDCDDLGITFRGAAAGADM